MEIMDRLRPGVAELFRHLRPESRKSRVAALDQFVNDQEAENKTLGFEKGIIFTKDQLIGKYKSGALFRKLDQEARSQFENIDPSMLPNLEHRFAGRIFEDMAYLQLAQYQIKDSILLSPDRTSALYQMLYPDEEKYPRMQDAFGGVSIRGISVPDGVFVERTKSGPRITAMCEYKAGMSGKNNNDNSMLINALKHLQVSKENFPSIFGHSVNLIVVSQRNAVLPTARAVTHQADNIDLIGLPFDNHEFRSIVDGFLVPYLPQFPSGTLASASI